MRLRPFSRQSFAARRAQVFEESDQYTFYLTLQDFEKMVTLAGGTYSASIGAKTNIVVLGATEKMFTKKVSDNWTGSTKQKALAKQQLAAADGTRKAGPLQLVTL